MNADILQTGVGRIHDYIAEYLYTRTRQKSIVALDVGRDLYDARTQAVRPFLNVLASKVVALYDEDREIKERLASRVSTARQFSVATPAVGAVLVTVGVALLMFVHYVEAGRDIKNIHMTFTVSRVLWEVLLVMGSISFLIVLSRQARADAEVVKTNMVIDLREQVPYTNLLWDPAIRLVHYNTFTDQDKYEAKLESDPDHKAILDQCEEPPQVGFRAQSVAVAASPQQGKCTPPTPFRLTDQYLKDLRQWIVDFYTHRDEIVYRLRTADGPAMTRRLSNATTQLTGLLKTSRVPTMSTADADAYIDRTILPLVLSKMAQFDEASVVTNGSKPYSTFENLSSDECVDRCIADAPRCGMASAADGGCRLYDAKDWPGVGRAGGGKRGQVMVPDRGTGTATVFTRGVLAEGDARRTKAFISQRAYGTLKDCADACSTLEDCGFCTKQAGRYFMGASGEPPGLTDATQECKDDCYYFKNASPTAPALNSDRIQHLAGKIAVLYATNGIMPDAAHDRLLDGLRKALSPQAFAQAKPLYEDLLRKTKEECTRVTRETSAYATDRAFVTTLGGLTKAEFVAQLVMPVHDIKVAVKALQDGVATQDRIDRLRSGASNTRDMVILVNIIVLTMVCLGVVGYYMVGKDWLRMSVETRTLSVTQYLVLTLGVIFFIILVSGYRKRRDVDAASQLDDRQKATRRLQGTSLAADSYLDEHMPLVSKLLGRSGLSRDPYTGKLLDANHAPVDLRDVAWTTPIEAGAVGDELLVFASEMRALIIVMDQTVNDCSDILGLRPTLAFPWNEVMLSVLGIVAIYLTHMFMSRYLMPGELLQKLRMLARRAKFQDFNVTATVDATQDFAAQLISMLVLMVVLILMMYSSVYSTQHYRAQARSACDKRRTRDD